jgi:predicted CopG family antitoxin
MFNIQLLVLVTVKTITIRKDVYKKLLKIKKQDESFSELFERLSDAAGPDLLSKLRGSVEFNEKKKMLAEISSARSERR